MMSSYSTICSSANGHNASSPSTGSDFEFDSCSFFEINDDPPVSPKLICPSPANYWSSLSNNGRLKVINMQQSTNPLPFSPPHTPVMDARQQPSAPSSPSMRQLMAEELSSDHKGYDFDFYSSFSAPQTPNSQQKQGGQDVSSLRGINDDLIKRKSAVMERRALDLSPLMMQKQVCGLEDNYSNLSSSNESSAAVHPVDINEFDHHKYSMDEAAASKISMKKHSSNSNKKWAFKDLLRRTVPSSRSDPHHNQSSKYANQKFDLPRQSTSTLINSPKPYLVSSGLSKSAPISPVASPSRSPAAAVHSPATIVGRPSPTRSSPRPPPMSPHALHYKQQKAHSDELRRKTFLPYRQSLLGCLGGATMSESRALQQQVW